MGIAAEGAEVPEGFGARGGLYLPVLNFCHQQMGLSSRMGPAWPLGTAKKMSTPWPMVPAWVSGSAQPVVKTAVAVLHHKVCWLGPGGHTPWWGVVGTWPLSLVLPGWLGQEEPQFPHPENGCAIICARIADRAKLIQIGTLWIVAVLMELLWWGGGWRLTEAPDSSFSLGEGLPEG